MRADVRLVIVPRLGAAWYRKQLEVGFPELATRLDALYREANDRKDFASALARILVANGSRVVISPENNRLPGFEWRPRGILWELFLPENVPEHQDTLAEVLSYCDRLSHALEQTEVDLAFTTELTEKLVLPLHRVAHAASTQSQEQEQGLRNAIVHIIDGDFIAARESCRAIR